MINLLFLIAPLLVGFYLIDFWKKDCGKYRGRYFWFGIGAIVVFMWFWVDTWFWAVVK